MVKKRKKKKENGISCRDMVCNSLWCRHNAAVQSTSAAEMRCAASGNEWPWIQGRVQILNDTGKTAFLLCMLYRALLLLHPCSVHTRDDSSSISFMFMICAMVDQVPPPIKPAWSLRSFFPPPRQTPARACVSGSSYRCHWRLETFRLVSSGLLTLFYREWSVWAAGALVVPADRGKAVELGQCHETENFPCHLKPCGIYNQAKNILLHYLATTPPTLLAPQMHSLHNAN